jgi:hypothetical protein
MDAPYNFSYPGLNSPHRPSIIHAKATTADQKKQFDPLGLTIVSFVREADGYPLKSACARLHDCRPSFHSFAATLHQTLLGVLGRDQPDLEDEQRRQIESSYRCNERCTAPGTAVCRNCAGNMVGRGFQMY